MSETITAPSGVIETSAFLKHDQTVDNVDTVVLVSDQGKDVNGFVFKANPSAATAYGEGQAFMVLEEGVGDATDQSASGSVMFRVDRHGNVGFAGGLHVATGLRSDDGQTQAVWIQPTENMIGMVISNPSVAEAATWDKNFIQVTDVRPDPDVTVFRVGPAGEVVSKENITARGGLTTQAVIGDIFGVAGIGLGSTSDTLLYRVGASIVGVGNALELPEMTTPANPAVNKGRLFLKDNGSGKTQLCVIFNTGAAIVLATQA